jgi:bifunctional UDP-N-acetylglucosamine pyrophosphorylase/glucosamine-1-phosphate N-acetyltransferase
MADGPAKALYVIVLAAGQGKRMGSELPKVLHHIAGEPMLAQVLKTARRLEPAEIRVVFGHGGDQVPAAFPDESVEWVHQAKQEGTGHAVALALEGVPDAAPVLVLMGDTPLVRRRTLDRVLAHVAAGEMTVLTAEPDDPSGLGRIVRDPTGQLRAIVEERDADEQQRAIREVNTGIMGSDAGRMRAWLARVNNKNVQGEYYLTDIIALAVKDGARVHAVQATDALEVAGINDKLQLATAERIYQRRQAEALCQRGVTVVDPERLDIRGTVQTGRDVTLDINVVLVGEVVLNDGVHVGPGAVIRNSELGAGTKVQPHCVIDGASIGRNCRIGPFARIRPETRLAEEVHVGNFVEVKKSTVGEGSKMNHLSYIGDTTVGKDTNIGAGTITCNYDGASKHRTVIGDDVFIGSNTQLVAPVTVEDGATIGAGSTITRDAPAGKLSMSRSKQVTVPNWNRPKKKPE